jgi:putative intracellular protease/amidase
LRPGPAGGRIGGVARMRRIVFVCFPGVEALDVTGPWEVFSFAGRAGGGTYELELVSPGSDWLRGCT